MVTLARDVQPEVSLKSAICPGCAHVLQANNTGCAECGYKDSVSGRILTLEEIIDLPAGDLAHTFDEVSPAFIAAVVRAARGTTPL